MQWIPGVVFRQDADSGGRTLAGIVLARALPAAEQGHLGVHQKTEACSHTVLRVLASLGLIGPCAASVSQGQQPLVAAKVGKEILHDLRNLGLAKPRAIRLCAMSGMKTSGGVMLNPRSLSTCMEAEDQHQTGSDGA